AAGTAAHNADALRVRVYLRGAPQRANDVRDIVARLDEREHLRTLSRGLEVEGHRSLLRIVVRDGEREPFTVFIQPENGKLTRFCAPCYERSFNAHAINSLGGVDRVFFSNSEHVSSIPPFAFH